MRLSTGRWVSGDDFFDRAAELRLLESQVRDRNHVLLSGQRRMGKTSIVRELGRRLDDDGWIFLFADVEGADCPEDLVAAIAEAAHPIRSISARVAAAMQRFFAENVEEISAQEFRLKISPEARRRLERQYAGKIEDVRGCVSDVLDVLVHDGYLERDAGGYRFPLHPLKDWWAGRFRDHHVPLRNRRADHDAGEP